MQIPITFRTPEQEQFFNLKKRNTCFSGGFGNGKTHAGCLKLIYLLATFPRYRAAVARFEESKLKQSTMKTFFEICPPELYDPKKGGNRADSLNQLKLVNGSEVLFMNLKDTDDAMVRGLEVNSVLIDQAEEISENMYIMLSARVGRWTRAKVPAWLLDQNPDWPTDNFGRHKVPNYMMILCNPDSELHWIYRRYHPESEEYQEKWSKNHEMIQAGTTTATVEEELLEDMRQNDPSWVQRFIEGKWGIQGGQIHNVLPASVLDFADGSMDNDLLQKIINRGNLSRVLDHGDASPTCCLWFSAYKNWFFCYREYYKPNALISDHRRNIGALSGREKYNSNLIDPQCAKKTLQKYGGTWTHIDEYADRRINAPVINFAPADNNEFATRNIISELLRIDSNVFHPVTGEKGAPRLYFIKQSPEYPNGCKYSLSQLRAAKRQKIGTVNGKDIYSDDRDDSVADHAYDPIRYYCASHANSPTPARPKVPEGSFHDLRRQLKALRTYGRAPLFDGSTGLVVK